MHPEIILDALRASGATFLGEEAQTVGDLSKQDLVEMGLSGGPQSAQMRLTLLKHLGLPEHMSANALLEALNLLYSREEVLALVNNIFEA
jgi:ribonuclease M5